MDFTAFADDGRSTVPSTVRTSPRSHASQAPQLEDGKITFEIWLFGLCYAMNGGYKRWNPYRERHLAIFVNCF
ncbi:hypothetical protein B1L04_28945 [Microcystis aeruginosa KW]|uniref:Uncharacterized protein n=1 Tax=Microcystis aeruginosa KW TaxID=1960155 RepID=A0A1V4BL77_MICAE|nr:hypothetical protein B1L04_28945 [Microcystis aeruginosa KW]